MRYAPLPVHRRVLREMLGRASYGVFLSPGSGKTALTLAALEALKKAGQMQAALIVAPIRPLRATWRQEREKWGFDLRLVLVDGPAQRRVKLLREPADAYLINPELLQWLETVEADLRADVLVIDESQKFKNPAAARCKALRRMLPRFRRRYILTGTPAAEGLIDLWHQILILDNGHRLGRTLGEFRSAYCVPGRYVGPRVVDWQIRSGADVEIHAKIADICYRLNPADFLQLPERTDNVIALDAPNVLAEERRVSAYIDLGNLSAATEAQKLRQIAGGAVYDVEGRVHEIDGTKLDALADLVEEHQGEPVLVAVAFQHETSRILARLRKVVRGRVEAIQPGMAPKAVDAVLAAWNARSIAALIINPISCSAGLNLQHGGRSLIWYTLPWSLDQYVQTNARIWRQGQSRAVVIHHLLIKGSIDEVVYAALQRKHGTQEQLYEALEAHIRALRG